MASIDSYKLAVDLGSLADVNLNRMDHSVSDYATSTTEMLPEERPTREKYTIVNPAPGIKHIEINESTGRVILQGSAKVLRDQYGQGINLNTFDRVISAYNKTGIILLNPVEVMKTGELFTVDVPDNLVMDEPPDVYISALNRFRCNEKYQTDLYRNGGRTVNGIVFKGKQRTIRERQIFYDKEKDVARDKDLKYLAPQFRNVLRVESNYSQLRKIRDTFGSNRLQDVLSSPVNANYLLFEKIVSKASNDLLRLFSEVQNLGMTMSQAEKLKGREGIVRDVCHMDWNLVNEWIRGMVRGGKAKYNRLYREVFISLGVQQGEIIDFTNKYIEEIKMKLSA